jgi:lysophospholipase L1-like esterase
LRGAWTYAEGYRFRWRSEGYATTRIGAHGMPGRVDLPAEEPGSIRVALWGDSQAEGLCVADDEKLFAQADRLAREQGRAIDFLPLARSGEEAADWLTQFRSVERGLGVDLHVLVIVDLPDLFSATAAPLPSADRGAASWRSTIAASVPAFLIQAVRYVITDADDQRRRLRFSVGPVIAQAPVGHGVSNDRGKNRGKKGREVDWGRLVQAIGAATDHPVILVYAPNAPRVTAGRIRIRDSSSEMFDRARLAAESQGLPVVALEGRFAQSALGNRWPHGFQNGQIGSGHLNAVGYQLIAEELVPAVIRVIDGEDQALSQNR